jgi:methylmalonyl-CoA decarboxylase
MNEQLRMLAGAHPMSPRRFERVQGLRRIVYDSDDYAEGIRAFKKKKAEVLGSVIVTTEQELEAEHENHRP